MKLFFEKLIIFQNMYYVELFYSNSSCTSYK